MKNEKKLITKYQNTIKSHVAKGGFIDIFLNTQSIPIDHLKKSILILI